MWRHWVSHRNGFDSREKPAPPTSIEHITCTSVSLLMSLCASLYQTATTAATPGAAVVAVWASRVTTAACWGAGTQPTAPPRAPPTAGFTLTTDWWAELSSHRECTCLVVTQVVRSFQEAPPPQIKCTYIDLGNSNSYFMQVKFLGYRSSLEKTLCKRNLNI